MNPSVKSQANLFVAPEGKKEVKNKNKNFTIVSFFIQLCWVGGGEAGEQITSTGFWFSSENSWMKFLIDR